MVRLEGVILEIKQHDLGLLYQPYFYKYVILFKGGGYSNATLISEEAMQHAELVPTPVTFDKEQIGQFNHFLTTLLGVKEEDKRSIVHWLREHEDNSRLE